MQVHHHPKILFRASKVVIQVVALVLNYKALGAINDGSYQSNQMRNIQNKTTVPGSLYQKIAFEFLAHYTVGYPSRSKKKRG
jgi:hypothetical protein